MGKTLDDIISVSGPYIKFRAKGENQTEYVRMMNECDIVFCTGPSGTGKTACATAIGLQQLLNGTVNKLIITRPLVECGRSMGFLPGNKDEKVHEFMVPVLEELERFLEPSTIRKLIKEDVIRMVPINFMRGRNFHNSFIIADEMQNSIFKEVKALITRIGYNSTMVITGDLKQTDLIYEEQGAMLRFIDILNDLPEVGHAKLEIQDIQRHGLLGKIIERVEKHESDHRRRP